MQRIILFLLLLTGVMSAKADNITVGGLNRSYNVYAPQNLGDNRPLLIFCHGASQDANWMQNSEFKNDKVSMEAVCDTAKFVVVFPNGIDNMWDISGDRDINFVKAIIEKMADQYNIDRNRVYLGGFSMGGMFTYHAMNKIPDLIAAFAPVSGYPMGGATANASVRPIPILHIHGTADDRCQFSGVQSALNVWINHNGCPTTATVVNNYNGFGGAKMHTWAPGTDGVEVKLLELAGKGHWICKEQKVYTGSEIWNFCKRFSLNKTKPNISIKTSGLKYICYAPTGSVAFPDVTVTATANDPNGTVEKVEFYDGTKRLATCTETPYQVILLGAKVGTHTLKAVVTDNDGETNTATVDVTFQTPITLVVSNDFKEGDALPLGWTTYDSENTRSGYSSGYTSGCRVLQFTGSSRGLDYGLYFRNINGNAYQGWAKYGLADGGTTLHLSPGHYTMRYKACNWDMSSYGAVEVNVEKRSDGTSIARQTYTPTVNIGNDATNNFASLKQQTLEFDVTEEDDYVIAVYSDAKSWSDCILGQLTLKANSYNTTGIDLIHNAQSTTHNSSEVYDLQGRRGEMQIQNGIYIINGKKILKK